MPEKVTITKAEYDRLLGTSAHMSELQARGVDNWGDYVGEANYCNECDEEMTWAETECPKCKTAVPDDY